MKRLLLPALALVLVVTAGCTTKTGGTASAAGSGATSGSAPTSTSRAGGKSAPKVSKPLNAATLASDPCSALSAAQLSTLSLDTGTPRTGATGPTCSWRYTDDETRSNSVGIAMDPNTDGLQGIYDLYAQKGKQQYEYFQPTVVFGYPGVVASSADLRSRGQCVLDVALTDQQAAQVIVQLLNGPGKTNPCPFALKAGSALIETLKGS